MDLNDFKRKFTDFNISNLPMLTDDELIVMRQQLNHLWYNGVQLREIHDLFLEEFLKRGNKKAMAYNNDEIISFLIESSFSGRVKEAIIDKKVTTSEALVYLKKEFTSSGGTLSDKKGFFIGMKMFSSFGVEIIIRDREYAKRDIMKTTLDEDDDRRFTVSYSDLFKRALKIYKPKLSLDLFDYNSSKEGLELLECDTGQLALF